MMKGNFCYVLQQQEKRNRLGLGRSALVEATLTVHGKQTCSSCVSAGGGGGLKATAAARAGQAPTAASWASACFRHSVSKTNHLTPEVTRILSKFGAITAIHT